MIKKTQGLTAAFKAVNDLKASEKSMLIVREPSEAKQTLGTMTIFEGGKPIKEYKTMELDWEENKFQNSCIPPGIYPVEKRYSPKYGNHFHVKDVPNRDMILIHIGNYHSDLLGCIAPGLKHIDINKDGLKDVTSSLVAMKELNQIMPPTFQLEIR